MEGGEHELMESCHREKVSSVPRRWVIYLDWSIANFFSPIQSEPAMDSIKNLAVILLFSLSLIATALD